MLSVRKLDSITKGNLIILIYDVFPEIDISKIHSTIKKFQTLLESKYGCTLGYSFKDVPPIGFYDYDTKLQEDLESYESLGKVIDSSRLTEGGKFILGTSACYNLEKQFGKGILDKLREDIKKLS